MARNRLIGAIVASVALLLSGCSAAAEPAATTAADAVPKVTATSLCADLNPVGFVESRDLVASFENELGVSIPAEEVVARCEDFPDESIDAAVRAVLDGKAASEADTAEGSTLLTYAWTDSDGYTFDLVIDSSVIQATTDIANAKQGEALVDVTVASIGSVTNTTPGRNATVRQSMNLAPVWSSSSTVCKYLRPVAGAPDGEWCTLLGSNLTPRSLYTDETTVAEGGTTVLRNIQNTPFQITVQEADAEAVAAELEAPAGFLLGIGSLQTSGGCLMGDTAMTIAASTVQVTC